MQQVTVQDCLEKIGNHFALTILAAERARHLQRAANLHVSSEHRVSVAALRDIAAGHVAFAEPLAEALERYLRWMRTRGVVSAASIAPLDVP